MNINDFSISEKKFLNVKQVIKTFKKKIFLKKNVFEREILVNETLFKFIDKEKTPCFLLPQVLDYIEKINTEKILPKYEFSSFELWLNDYSKLSFEENYFIRAKIAGKYIPRDEYQKIFPIGLNKVYEGSHIVTSHESPDLDSMIGSFWGWVDAFAARVGNNLHVWNVPQGPVQSQEIEIYFKDVFGPAIFKRIMKTNSSLTLTGKDLLHFKNLVLKKEEDSIADIDHKRHNIAVVVINSEGYYLGDWRSFDYEDVKSVTSLLDFCLQWFKNKIKFDLLSLFSKKDFYEKEFESFIIKIFNLKLKNSDPFNRFDEDKKKILDDFLKNVLNMKKGIEVSFFEFSKDLSKLSLKEFERLYTFFKEKKSLVFENGKVKEDRSKIFKFFEKIMVQIEEVLNEINQYLGRLDVALKVKYDVFGYMPSYVTINDEVEEIKNKMGPNQFLSVVMFDEGKNIPIGVIRAIDLKKRTLGTVSFRDFSSKEDINMSSYLDVISVIDHHKTSLNTLSPPCMIVSDVQSTNTIMAQMSFEINDRYSVYNMKKSEIDKQIEMVIGKKEKRSNEILKRLFQKKNILEKKEKYFIHPYREFLEYLHFLFAILDDTDLLMKVSKRDIEYFVSLLNRMKSIIVKKEVEIIDISDLEKDENFLEKAANRILKNKEMYLIYKKIYLHKEKDIEKNIKKCVKDKSFSIFSDVKIQNRCARVGQTKIFFKNVKYFEKNKNILKKRWLEETKKVFLERNDLDLHIHMISTIRGAKEVFEASFKKYLHKDEIWIWIPYNEIARIHLKKFLKSFWEVLSKADENFYVEIYGMDYKILENIFNSCLYPIKKIVKNKDMPHAVIYFQAGKINSRKTMISPYLPKLID
ncbi:MAG: hypothetical protein AMS24_04825 [Chlamydiae bacterium SM23_39]|nr:MAG: hypothetical protein AMS24_04825 [Chlamydiae bacterium SM23_39]